MRLLVLSLSAIATVWAQADAIRAAMESSLEKQRQSIRSQVASAVPAVGSSAAFFSVPWPKPVQIISDDCDALPKDKVEELITKAATREQVKPEVIREVMRHESAFKPCAVSVAGAQGLMQLMPSTAEQFGVKDPFDPEQNVAAGTKFLKQLIDKYGGDLKLALAAYNSGPATVDRVNGVPKIPETQNYVKDIMEKLVF